MCGAGQGSAVASGVPSGGPASADEALGMVMAGLGWLAKADLAEAPVAVQAECLRQLERARSVQTAAHASILSAFDRADGYAGDGQGTARVWLQWQTQITRTAASALVGWMRRLRDHPAVAEALREARISASWAQVICALSDRLPEWARGDADAILLRAAADGAELADLIALLEQMLQLLGCRDDGSGTFEDRQLHLGVSIDGSGRLEGDLTPQCTEALDAVLDALGKKLGPEDTRTRAQRRHDALYEACRRLIGAKCLPDRAGQPTQLQVHITLEELLRRWGAADSSAADAAAADDDDDRAADGRSGADEDLAAAAERVGVGGHVGHVGHGSSAGDPEAGQWSWLGLAMRGRAIPAPPPGWPLAGPGDDCDASIAPIVAGSLDQDLLDKLVAQLTAPGRIESARPDGTGQFVLNTDSVRDLVVANAAALFSGPRGLASWLRRRVLTGAAASVSLPLDTAQSTETIPAHLRRAVILRDQHCAAPGCDVPPAACSVHHIEPRRRGGITKLDNLLLLCSFHHLILVHRWGWTIALNSDGTTTMTSPDGTKVFRSHGPPPAAAA